MEIPGRTACPVATLTLPALGEIEPARLLALHDLFCATPATFPIPAAASAT